MEDTPITAELTLPGGTLSRFTGHTVRTLSDMRGYYADTAAYEALLAQGDRVLYEVYEVARPALPGELSHGTTILYPGQVGEEYVMTKGHYHAIRETSEVYYCLLGEGMMVMEKPDGATSVQAMCAGTVLYVPPRWAHRTVNTGQQPLVTFWVYPAVAGHDYASIQERGFRKIVVERGGGPAISDNARFQQGSAGSGEG